jgi:putative nucleotidyltransferase with HDIG domain
MSNTISTINPASSLSIEKLLTSIEDLPSIPETLMEILKVLDDPNSGAMDLADVVRLDAPLMAKVLRLANSPYYSQRGDLADINRCVAVLGYRTVRQVAICITVASTVISAVSHSRGQMDYRELWKHSVVTGAIAKHLASMVGYPDPEEIFTGGLLHDMGKFVLELHSPQEYEKVIGQRAQTGLSLCSEEVKEFGFSHAAIGQAFGQSWRFPELLVSCFGAHHETVFGTPTNRVDHAVALVTLADYLANTMVPSHSDLGFDPKLVDPVQLHKNADIEVRFVEENLTKIRESVSLASAYLDIK